MGFTTGNEWKNQHGIKFPCCFHRGLLSEFFIREISFSLLNMMIKPYQRHIACQEGLWQLFPIITSLCTVCIWRHHLTWIEIKLTCTLGTEILLDGHALNFSHLENECLLYVQLFHFSQNLLHHKHSIEFVLVLLSFSCFLSLIKKLQFSFWATCVLKV